MTYNFEFIKEIPELCTYYDSCISIEKMLSKNFFIECYKSIKTLIEQITYDTCIIFNIDIETCSIGDFSISAQWNSPAWMKFIDESSLVKDVKTIIKNRNALEHVKKKTNFEANEENSLSALQVLQDFLTILYCKYTNLNIEEYKYSIIEMSNDDDQIEINNLKDQLQEALDNIEEIKNQEPIVEVRVEYISENITLEYKMREEL